MSRDDSLDSVRTFKEGLIEIGLNDLTSSMVIYYLGIFRTAFNFIDRTEPVQSCVLNMCGVSKFHFLRCVPLLYKKVEGASSVNLIEIKFSDSPALREFINHTIVMNFGSQVLAFYSKRDESLFEKVKQIFCLYSTTPLIKNPLINNLVAPVLPLDASLHPILNRTISIYWQLLSCVAGLYLLEPDADKQDESDIIAHIIVSSIDYLLLGMDNNPGCNVYYLNMHE